MPSLDTNKPSPTLPPLDRAELAIERGTTALRQGEFLEAANCFWMASDYLRQAGHEDSSKLLARQAHLAMTAVTTWKDYGFSQ